MAEEDATDEEKPKSRTQIYILVGAAAVLIVVLLFIVLSGEENKKVRRVKPRVVVLEVEDPDKVLSGGVYKPEPFIVNLKENSGLLRISLAIEFYDFEPPEKTKLLMAATRDAVITIAGSYSASELVRSDIKEQFKTNLLILLEERLPEANPPRHIYFEEFNIQPVP